MTQESYFASTVPAGFLPPSADDFIEKAISLDEIYLDSRESTYIVRVRIYADNSRVCEMPHSGYFI